MFVCPDEQPLYVRWWYFSIDFWWMRWAAFSCWCVVLFFFSSFFSPFWFWRWHFCSVVIWGKSLIICSIWTLFPFVPVTGSFCLVCAKLLMCVSWLEFLFWECEQWGIHPLSGLWRSCNVSGCAYCMLWVLFSLHFLLLLDIVKIVMVLHTWLW